MRPLVALLLGVPAVSCASTRPPTTEQTSPPRVSDAGARAERSSQVPATSAASLAPPPPCADGERLPEVADVPDSLTSLRWGVRGALTALPEAAQRACAQITARAEAARRSLAPVLVPTDASTAMAFGEIGVCHAAGQGAWVLLPGIARRLVRRHPLHGARETIASLGWTLAFVRPDGRVLRASHAHARGTALTGDGNGHGVVRLVYDYDHDGVAELLLERHTGDPTANEPHESVGLLFTLRAGAPVPAPFAPEGSLEAPIDADRDGVPDLLVRSPYAAGNTCGPSVFHGPSELAHARADGTFSRDDGHARAWMRQRCDGFEATPTTIFPENAPGGEVPYRVACWRYWGTTASALQALMRASWSEDDDDRCTSRTMSLQSIEVAPRFILRSPCAARTETAPARATDRDGGTS